MNSFSYLARDLLTWAPLDPLPYEGVGFGRILDQHGAWQGSLPLASEQVKRFAWKDATRPSRTALFVDLQGTLVWGGIIWTCNYQSDDPTKSLKVGAVEFGSYFQHRLQAEDYSTLWEAGEDPMKIVKRVIEDAQTKEHEGPGYITASKIPIVLHGPEGSEYNIAVSYPAASLQTIDSITSTLTQIGFGPGFDFSWDVEYLTGTKTPAVTLNLYRPLIGRTAQESGIVILGRDTVKWSYAIDGTAQATEVTETGSGTGGLPPEIASASYPGYPLLQKATARTQIMTASLLAEIALGELALIGYPVASLSVVLPLSLPDTPAQERQTLALGEFGIGDRLIFHIDPEAAGVNADPRFPEGCEHEWRINQYTVTPADRGLGTLQLDLGPPPLGPPLPPPAPPE